MAKKLVLLTGIPGIGKSTIAQYIEKRIQPIIHFGFGDLIHDVMQGEGKTASRTRIRTTPDKFVSINTIKTAAEVLLDQMSVIRQTSNVLLETHAVVKDYYGFWIVPEISDFEAARLDAIIVIHTPFEIIEQRMIKEPGGRYKISKQTFEKYQRLQDTVAVNFSLMAECPMYVVETDNDLVRTEEILLHIFENIGMSFKKT